MLARLTLAQLEIDRERHAAARDHLDIALPLATSVFGEDNLYTAVTRAYRGLALAGLGDLSSAEREADAAVAAVAGTYGDDSVWLAEVLMPRAEVRRAQGRPADARADLERVLALLDPRDNPIQRAQAEFSLAELLWEVRGERVRARALAESAQAILLKAGAARQRAEIDRWLTHHPH